MDISHNDIVFALDIGTRTVIGAVCKKDGNVLNVIAQSILEHDSRSMIDGQVHDIDRVSEVVRKVKKELEEKIGFTLKEVAIAAAGRTLMTKCVHVEQDLGDDLEIDGIVINSLELSGVNEAARAVRDGASRTEDYFYCVGYSIVSYYLNGYPITNLLEHKGRYIGADVLATFLPQSVVSSLYKVLEKSGLVPMSLTLEPIAALEAIVPENIRLINIALVDIGAGTSDIAITRKGSITAYGMVSVAGDEITEALAEEYIVDFNTAEAVKRSVSKKKKISFKDVTGTKVSMDSRDVLSSVSSATNRLAGEISKAIISLNGEPPKALFCVGGGSQTPGLIDALSRELNMDKQRIAVKKRDSIPNLEVCDSIAGGPEGVTVVGIAIVAFKKVGHDFVNIYVNGKEYRLFNSSDLTVCDVLGLIGYNPSALIGRSGRSVRFKLNGEDKKVAGLPPVPPVIQVNREAASLDTKVKGGDFINIKDAQNGQDASTAVRDCLKGYSSVSFTLDGQGYTIEPECTINGALAAYDAPINEGDEVSIYMALSAGEQLQRLKIELSGRQILVNGKVCTTEYRINDGDSITICDIPAAIKVDDEKIIVTVNGKNVVLKGRNHIFIDIFNAMDLGAMNLNGNVKVTVNGKNAGYTEVIKDGDIIEIR